MNKKKYVRTNSLIIMSIILQNLSVQASTVRGDNLLTFQTEMLMLIIYAHYTVSYFNFHLVQPCSNYIYVENNQFSILR